LAGRSGWPFSRETLSGIQPNKGLRAHDYILIQDSTSSLLSRSTPVEQMFTKCRHLFLKNGVDQPLIKVTLLPCKDCPDTHFALIVSISHIVADGHTYYALLSQLCSRSSNNIQTLTADRITNTVEQQRAVMGRDNYDEAVKPPGVRSTLNSMWQILKVKIGLSPPTEGMFVLVDSARMAVAKQMAVSGNADNSTKFVSTNDVLTSWLFEKASCNVGSMLINWRNRLEGHTDYHAGNYELGILYRKPDWATPSLIRASLENNFHRAVTTKEPLPGYRKTLALSANWSTFAMPNEIEDCQEELHIPLVETETWPPNIILMIIFRAFEGQLGVYFQGPPNKLDGLHSPPFLMEERLK